MKTGFLLVCFVSSCSLFAQESSYRHSISGELSRVGDRGLTGLYAHYDYMFNHSGNGFFDASAGLGGYFRTGGDNGLAIRQGITYNLGSKRHFFEGGLSGAYTKEYYSTESHEGYSLGPQVGYRSISLKGFQFRIYIAGYYGAYTYYALGLGFGKAYP